MNLKLETIATSLNYAGVPDTWRSSNDLISFGIAGNRRWHDC